MKWIEVIKNANRDARETTLYWFVVNLVFLVSPIVITYFFSYLETGMIDPYEPISHGEFPLYGLSMVGSGVLVLIKSVRISGLDQIRNDSTSKPGNKLYQMLSNVTFPGSKFFIVCILIETLFSVAVFCATFVKNDTLPNSQIISQNLFQASIWVMLSCILTSMLITLTDASLDQKPPSVKEMFDESYNEFRNKFDEAKWEEK